MKKKYNEIIEIEYIDNVLKTDLKFGTRILLLTTERINSIEEIKEKYKFDVISYGFHGYYPVIGVQYLNKTNVSIEDYVLKFFDELILNISIKDLIEFDMINCKNIQLIVDNINIDNKK